VEDGQVWIFQMHIAPYEQGTYWNVEPRRKRRLLLHKTEIHTIRTKTEQKGLTLIPLKVFFHHGYAKVEIGLAKGKKLYDKREDIAQKDMEREQRRATFGRE
jgi:SsrA-binding protein